MARRSVPPPAYCLPAGEVISRTSVLNKAAGFSVDVGGVKWAYRKSDPAEGKASPDKLPVLLIHGLGSSSWSYRCATAAGSGSISNSSSNSSCAGVSGHTPSARQAQHSVCVDRQSKGSESI